jgi:NADH-quinone oxidoreductase subunit I
LCEDACPKDAIYLSETFAPSNYSREGFIYTKNELLIPDLKTEPEKLAQAKGN